MSNFMTGMPSFSLIGRSNAGKSSILATLLECDSNMTIAISSTAGETRRNNELFLNIGGNGSHIRFFDTPGFQDATAAKQKIISIQEKNNINPQQAITSFCEAGDTEFIDERRLLTSLDANTLPIYIINPEFSFQESFAAEVEILEMAGFPREKRIALINLHSKDGTVEPSRAWRQYLEKNFAHIIEFDPHNARFTERKNLLEKLAESAPLHKEAILSTIKLLEQDWSKRRIDAAQQILDAFLSALQHEQTGHFTRSNEREKKVLEDTLISNFRSVINQKISTAKQSMLSIYRYEQLAFEDSLSIEKDLEWDNHETWERLGLSRQQLTIAASAASAVAGAGIDTALGGISMGAATIGAALIGGSFTFFTGDKIPTFSMKTKNIRRSINSLKGPQNGLTVSFPVRSNLPWVMLDHLLISFAQILTNTHGKRGAFNAKSFENFTNNFSQREIKIFSKFFSAVSQGNNKHSEKVLDLLVSILKKIESQKL